MERVQKILSRAGIASRRASEQLMLQGRVSLNGTPVRELGTKADPALDDIRVDGRRVTAERPRFLLLNKPRGVVTTRSDPQRRPTVIDLIADVREHVYPVGRLDFDSEGLLILTNDGDLAAKLMHPRYGIPRVYEVRTAGLPDARDLRRLSSGAITIDGRPSEPALVRLLDGRVPPTVQVTVREGRNRQVRKMFEAVGHPVTSLRRVAFGPVRDPRLKPGCWRDLTTREIQQLRSAVAGPR
jgi:pseudouridine synthase